MPKQRSPIWVFGALSACLSAGYGVLFTVVGDYRDEYGISDTDVGLIIGIGFLSAFVAQVFIAPLADRGRARLLVVIGVFTAVAGLLLMAFGGAFAPIVAGRLINGIGIGTAVPAVRRIVVVSDPTNLGSNLGLLLSADVFGFAAGPAISAVLAGPLGLGAPFVVVAAASVLFMIPVLNVEVNESIVLTRQRLAVDLLKERVVAGAVALGAGVFLMIGTFDALWDVVHEDLNTPNWMANLGITLFALPLIVLGPTSGRLAQRVGPFRTGGVGLVVGAAFMASYGLLPTGTWIFAVSLGHAVSDGLTVTASGVAISMAVDEDRQAGAQGIMGAAQALAGGVSAIVIGAVYDSSGRAAAYISGAVGMLLLVVAMVLLAGPAIGKLKIDRSPLPRQPMAAGS